MKDTFHSFILPILIVVVIGSILIVSIFVFIQKPKIPPIIKKPVCGNNICEPGETQQNCCLDCGCPTGYKCDENQCKRLPLLKEIQIVDITKDFKILTSTQDIVDCIETNLCYKEEVEDQISLTIDDPSYIPDSLSIVFSVPVENLGDYELSNVVGRVEFDGKIIGSFSNGLSNIKLNPHATDRFTISTKVPLGLGTKSHTLKITISTVNQSFSFTFNIQHILYRAILEGPDPSEIDYVLKLELGKFALGENHKWSIVSSEEDCDSYSGCIFTTDTGNLDVNIQNIPYIIDDVKLRISFPIRNVGNKKFNSINLVMTSGSYNSLTFSKTGNSYTSLDTNEKITVNYIGSIYANPINIGIKAYDYSRPGLDWKQINVVVTGSKTIKQYYNTDCRGGMYLNYLDPLIQNQVKQIIKYLPTPENDYENVDEIYKWVYINIKTPVVEMILDPINVCNSLNLCTGKPGSIIIQDPNGMCYEKSLTVVTLARATKVPPERIRVVVGYACSLFETDEECKRKHIGHAWAEFYNVDDGKWYKLEMNELLLDILGKFGLTLNIWASNYIVVGFYSLLGERYLPLLWFNDQSCGYM